MTGDNLLFYLIGVRNISRHTHKARSCYLLEALFKISDEHSCRFYMRVSLPGCNYCIRTLSCRRRIPLRSLRAAKSSWKAFFCPFFFLLRKMNENHIVRNCTQRHELQSKFSPILSFCRIRQKLGFVTRLSPRCLTRPLRQSQRQTTLIDESCEKYLHCITRA